MSILVQTVLMMFAASAFAGAGSCRALQQHKRTYGSAGDAGLAAVMVMLVVFGALCAGAAGGPAAILAVALPVGLAGYTVAARRTGLFRVQSGELESRCTEGSELHT